MDNAGKRYCRRTGSVEYKENFWLGSRGHLYFLDVFLVVELLCIDLPVCQIDLGWLVC
jgi:hypothetical protein